MKRKHGFWVLGVVVLGVALFGSIIASAGGAAQGREPYVTYDMWNDSSGAPDVRSVSMSDTGGIVTVTLSATGLRLSDESEAAATQADVMLTIDRSEYALTVGQDSDGLYAGFFWGFLDDWFLIPPTDTMTFSSSGDTYTFTFATADLGGASGFTFSAVSAGWNADGELIGVDSAPEEGVWSYWPLTTPDWNGGGAVASLPNGTLFLSGDDSLWHQVDATTLSALGYGNTPITIYGELPPASIGEPIAAIVPATPPTVIPPPVATTAPLVTPIIAKPVTYPAKPVAGKPFRLTFAITRSDTGGKLIDGKMICDPSVKGKVITHLEQLKNGTATMLFTIPKAYKGKYMKVHLTIKAGAESTTRDVMFHVA